MVYIKNNGNKPITVSTKKHKKFVRVENGSTQSLKCKSSGACRLYVKSELFPGFKYFYIPADNNNLTTVVFDDKTMNLTVDIMGEQIQLPEITKNVEDFMFFHNGNAMQGHGSKTEAKSYVFWDDLPGVMFWVVLAVLVFLVLWYTKSSRS